MKDYNNYPNGALLNICSRMFKAVVREKCDQRGINSTFYPIIMMLSKSEDGLIQNELCAKTNFKPSTISLTLKMLENLGYIIRIQDENDMRKTIVKLTKEGKLLDEDIKHCFDESEKILVKDLTDDQIDLFREVMIKMICNLSSEEVKEC